MLYANELAFINRKLVNATIKWDTVEAMEQVISQTISEIEAKNLINQLREALLKKAGMLFPKMVFSVHSKLHGGSRIVISIPMLREVFAGEIDFDSSGGGRGLNPLKTRPTVRGGRWA
jgi:hypothetical protein